MPSKSTVPENSGRIEPFSLIRRLPPDKPLSIKRKCDSLSHPKGFEIAISPEFYRNQFKRIKYNIPSLSILIPENITTDTIQLLMSSNVETIDSDRIEDGKFLRFQNFNDGDCNSSKSNKRARIINSTTQSSALVLHGENEEPLKKRQALVLTTFGEFYAAGPTKLSLTRLLKTHANIDSHHSTEASMVLPRPPFHPSATATIPASETTVAPTMMAKATTASAKIEAAQSATSATREATSAAAAAKKAAASTAAIVVANSADAENADEGDGSCSMDRDRRCRKWRDCNGGNSGDDGGSVVRFSKTDELAGGTEAVAPALTGEPTAAAAQREVRADGTEAAAAAAPAAVLAAPTAQMVERVGRTVTDELAAAAEAEAAATAAEPAVAAAQLQERAGGSEVVVVAAAMGVELLTEADYLALQALGEFDQKTSSWVKTPADFRKRGGALFGDRRYGRVFLYHNGAQSYFGARGFRGSVRV